MDNKENEKTPDSLEPIRGDLGGTIMGPQNDALQRQNPDQLRSPDTDAGTVPNLKFSYATARNRLSKGGWAPLRSRRGSFPLRPRCLALT